MKRGNAISLARVSDVDQTNNTSLAAQHDVNRMVMDNLGFDIVKCFSEQISGGKDRKTVRQALAFCKKWNTAKRPQAEWVQYLVIHSLSRWFRDTDKSGHFRYLFRELGVEVQAATEWTDKSKSGSVTMRALREGMAEDERLEGQRRSLKGVYYTWKEGYHQGVAMRGYRYVHELDARGKRIFCQDPELAPIYRDAFSMVAAGVAPMTVYRQLGGKAVFGVDTTYYKALRNSVYAGIKEYSSKLVELPDICVTLKVDAITDPQTFDMVQERLKNAEKGLKTPTFDDQYYAKDSLKCGCSASVTHESSKGRSLVYHYYRCCGNAKHGRVRTDRVHDFVERLMQSLVLSPAAIAYLREKAGERVDGMVQGINERIQSLTNSLTAMEVRRKKALRLLADEVFTVDDYNEIRSDSDNLRAEIERQRFVKDNQRQLIPKVMALLGNLTNIFDRLNNGQRGAMLKMFFPAGFYVASEKPNAIIHSCRTAEINSIFNLSGLAIGSDMVEVLHLSPANTQLSADIENPTGVVLLRSGGGVAGVDSAASPVWYPERGSNPYFQCWKLDFKSSASTNSAIRAGYGAKVLDSVDLGSGILFWVFR